MTTKYDLVIIGAGPGGYEAALTAAKEGLATTIIEARELGGTCLHRGCIPTKTIMHTTDLYLELKQHAEEIGLSLPSIGYDMIKIQQRKQTVLMQLEKGIAALLAQANVTVYHGTGTIIAPHRIQISGKEPILLEAEHILIATGSVPATPPITGADLPNVCTSDALLKSTSISPRLVIIGGGVIGMEFASIYSALGSQVTVIEAMDRILAAMDREIAQNLKMILKKRNVEIHTSATVASIEQTADGALCCYYREKEQPFMVEADQILIATGRKAFHKQLLGPGLSLQMEQGHIVVNQHYQTEYEHIYAIGDVIGGIQLAHVATAQGRNAVRHMVGKKPMIEISTVPHCVYTNPEIASVGITMEEAKAQNLHVVSKKYVMSANGKSILSLQERGFIKVIANGETHKIIGAQLMCARATDMISEFSTAIVNGLTLAQMAAVIRPHPTFSEGVSEAVQSLL